MNIDFILSSFPPLPDGMWVATSGMLDTTLSKCMKLLGGFVTLKMMHDWYEGYEEMNVSMHIRTLFRALALVVFFRYYKQLLMYFDYFIDALAIHESGTELAAEKLGSLGNLPGPVDDPMSFRAMWRYVKFFFKLIQHLAFLFSHMGAIYFMCYVRAVSMLLLVQLGPLAAVLSWLPGPFARAFQQWSKSYVTVSCWAITLRVFAVLSQSFGLAVMHQGPGAMLGHSLLSVVLFFMILMTPSWTAKFIGSEMLGGLVSGLQGWAVKAGQLAMKKIPVRKPPMTK